MASFKQIILFLFLQILFLFFSVRSSLAADVFTLSKTLEEPVSGSYFGQDLTVGDFNNDGYHDLVTVGEPSGEKRAYVYYGSSSGLGDTPNSTLADYGLYLYVYDLNIDGYDDLIMADTKYDNGIGNNVGRVSIWYGSSNHFAGSADFVRTGSVAGEYYGVRVVVANLTGDGYPEIICGSQYHDSSRGKMEIWLGEETITGDPDFTIEGENQGDLFATYFTSGRLNQDDYADLIVGASSFDSSRGKIYVYYGAATFDTTADVTVLGENTGDLFGASPGTIDLNNDGYDEALIGAWAYNSYAGRIYVYYGPDGIDDSADAIIDPQYSPCYLGMSLNSDNASKHNFGKYNNDDFYDLSLYCYGVDSNTGAVYLYYGGSGQINGSPNLTLTGEAANSRYGITIAGADLNNNGYEDLVIAGPMYNSWQGRAYIYWGGAELNNTEEQKMTGEATDDSFGGDIVAGDFNNDGYQELVIAKLHRTSHEGKLYLYSLVHGSPNLSFNSLNYSRDSSLNVLGNILNTGVSVGGTQYSLNSGSWQNCSCSTGAYDNVSESFNCSLGELTEGNHSLRLRSKTIDNVYMTSSAYSTNNFTVDRTLPASFFLNLPEHEEHVLDPRPVFQWQAASIPDDRSGISHYKFELKYSEEQGDGGFIIDNIPPSGTSDSDTEKYIIKYQNFSDSDDTNNYLFLQTKSSSLWGENNGLLKEGTNNWSVRAVDKAGNEREQARIVYYDLKPTPTPTFIPSSLTKTKKQLETKIIKEEKIPAETEEEKQRIKEEGYTVKVKVVNQKQEPVKGAKVTLHSEPREEYTNQEGMAIFERVEPGEHKVVIAYNDQEGEQKINLEGEIQEFRYTLEVKSINPLFSKSGVYLLVVLIILLLGLITFLLYEIKKRRTDAPPLLTEEGKPVEEKPGKAEEKPTSVEATAGKSAEEKKKEG